MEEERDKTNRKDTENNVDKNEIQSSSDMQVVINYLMKKKEQQWKKGEGVGQGRIQSQERKERICRL